MPDTDDAEHPPVTRSVRDWVLPLGLPRFFAYRPDGDTTSAVVEDAVAHANKSSSITFDADAAVADVVVPVGAEVFVRLAATGSANARKAWLKSLAAALPPGSLLRPRPDYGPQAVMARQATLKPLTTFAAARPGESRPLVAAMRRAYTLPAATAYVAVAENAFPLPDGPQVDRLLAQLVYGAPSIRLVTDDEHVAILQWSGKDRVTASLDTPEGWHAHARTARAALEGASPHLDYGYVRRGGLGCDWNAAHQVDPTPPAGRDSIVYFRIPSLWPNRVADAHGLQLLTATHLERATDLSAWDVTTLGDRYLVAARDPAPWFENPEPDPTVLAQARTDFGAMIATAEELAAIRIAGRAAGR